MIKIINFFIKKYTHTNPTRRMQHKNTATDRQWKRWAELDPYHGVLGRGFGLGDIERPDVRDRFFQQGEDHISRVLDVAKSQGLVDMESALDFGCGVGRLLLPLLGRFKSVTGIDVSPVMLKLAKENCGNVKDLMLFKTLDDVKAEGLLYDLVHSYIVLQHIRPKQGLVIMEQMLGLLKPNGIAAIHFTVGDMNRWRRRLNIVRYHIPPLHWLYNIFTNRHWNLPVSEMNAYPIELVLELFRRKLGSNFAGWSVDHSGHQGLMIIARKNTVD